MKQVSRFHNVSVSALLLLTLIACSQTPTADQAPPDPIAQQAPERAGARESGTVFRIVQPASELRVLVMRAGLLSRFGHNHVVGGEVITGTVVVQETLSDSSFEIDVDLAAMAVDRASWRQEEGEDFASVPSPEDIAGTRSNMLGEKVLDVQNFPTATAQSVAVVGQLPEFSVLARITLKGQTRSVPVPVRLDLKPDQLVASGEFTLTQSDFGIEPFSILLGAISVQDEVRVRYRIVANPID